MAASAAGTTCSCRASAAASRGAPCSSSTDRNAMTLALVFPGQGSQSVGVVQVCADAAQGQVLEPANLNSPVQVVIAGHRPAVERGMALAKARGAKIATMLPMSAPSHCSLMRPAADRLRERLAKTDVST